MTPRTTTRKCLNCGRDFTAPASMGRPPETCSPKCTKLRRRSQREASRQRAVTRGVPAHMHGTCTSYSHYKCRCAKCRGWAAKYKATRREATKPHEQED